MSVAKKTFIAPAPVAGEHCPEPVGVDGRARGVTAHPQAGQQVEYVVRVLGVELHDLELGQQQVSGVEGHRTRAERRLEVQRVAHRQPVHHDVDGAPGRGGEVHLPVPVQVVEPLVRFAARALQVAGDLAPALAQAGQVEILPRAQPGREIGTQDPDPEAAEDLELVTRLGRAAHQPDRLRQRVGRSVVPEAAEALVGCGHARSLLVLPRASSIMVTDSRSV
jgi:hypothetical protein